MRTATAVILLLAGIGWLAWSAAAPRVSASGVSAPPISAPRGPVALEAFPSRAEPAPLVAPLRNRDRRIPAGEPIRSVPAGPPVLIVPAVPFPRQLTMPIPGLDPRLLRNTFDQARGASRRHDAIDILMPRGTPIVAVDDGVVTKLFTSKAGGLTVYHFDPTGTYCYYYAHLENYAPALKEGLTLRRGDLIGYVGTTGNAPKDTPHLHFAIMKLDADRRWWGGTALNPYPLLGGK